MCIMLDSCISLIATPAWATVCGMFAKISQLTRGNYLVDLVFTDACKVTVLPEISDHRVVSLDIEVAASFSEKFRVQFGK